MHWLLDVDFGKDASRVVDRNAQRNLNILRKLALNSLRIYKDNTKSKKPLTGIMLDCLLDNTFLLLVLSKN